MKSFKNYLEEKLAAHIVRGDTYVGVPDRVIAQAKNKVKKMNLTKASDQQKAMNKVLSDVGWELTVGGKYVREEVELDEVHQEAANYLVSEGIKLEDLNEEELNELIGAVARGIGRGIKKVAVNKQGNFRFSAAGRADSVQKKADSLEKKQRDREKLQKQRERLQRLRQARNT